jgi:ribulose-phosphate 3-epimerase
MIEEPGKYAELFKKAGADILSVHIEACPHLHRNIQQIKSLGMKAGVAVNPHTPVELLKDILADIDQVCLMSVNPGFGGQSLFPNTINKIKQLRAMIDERSLDVKIEIDGGVTEDNARQIIDAGADILVAGSTVFKAADPIANHCKTQSTLRVSYIWCTTSADCFTQFVSSLFHLYFLEIIFSSIACAL